MALGQVTGRFYLEKGTYAVGEPVFLYFEATNSGAESQNISKADPYSFCSGYQIQVSSDSTRGNSCGKAIAGSCFLSDAAIEPGKTVTERILLNYEHKIEPWREYEIQAQRNLSYAPASEDFFRANRNSVEVHAPRLIFSVDENTVWGGADLQAWVEQLHSTDSAKRREAGRTLASIAPNSLESVLLDFADNSELRQWAPLAFHRLNTPASLAALARMLDTTQPGTYEHMKADDFLGATEDPKWFRLLLDVAQKNPKIANYFANAAESGGEQILPVLLSMLQSADIEFTRSIAISTFGYTGSRSAVPVLLGLLRSPDPGTAQRALYRLRQLTHRDIGGDRWFDNPQSQYSVWINWWNAEGASAPIYKPTECGEVKPLR